MRLIITALLMTLVVPVYATPGPLPEQAGRVRRHHAAGINEQYIVLLPLDTPTKAVDGLAQSLAATYNLQVSTTWEYVRGFLATGPLEAAERLANDSRVEIVEEDLLMRSPFSSGMSTSFNGQDLWYLDRLDEVYWDGRDSASVRDNTYDRCPTGATTLAYVVDMAVWAQHSAFTYVKQDGSVGSRVVKTVDCSTGVCNDTVDAAANCLSSDPNAFYNLNHGTAVASLLTGHSTGSAQAQVVSVNIFPCSGTGTSQSIILAAINWMWSDVQSRKANNTYTPSIVNHSGYVYPWDPDAISYATRARDFVLTNNVPYFTSADNFATDSCHFSPNMNAYTPTTRSWQRGVFVVGGTSKNTTGQDHALFHSNWDGFTDKRAQYRGSNLGSCVSAFAPAADIYTAAHGSASDYVMRTGLTGNGTSWAAPLAAGLALRALETSPSASYMGVYDWLMGFAPGDTTVPSIPKATVNAPARDPFMVCYSSTNPDDWYTPFQSSTCEPGYTPMNFPSVGNTSGARMISWTRTCQ